MPYLSDDVKSDDFKCLALFTYHYQPEVARADNAEKVLVHEGCSFRLRDDQAK